MINTSPYFIWMDLEMTDLDPQKGQIVEIATLVTNKALEVIEEGPDIVIHQPRVILDNMNTWCKDHFRDSGLLNEIISSKNSLAQAERKTLSFIKKHVPAQSGMLAGCSVHVDRSFLFHHMPSIYGYLHHHIIDVDTIKELSRHWYPKLPEFPKVEPHRALADIKESIQELKYYKENIFKYP